MRLTCLLEWSLAITQNPKWHQIASGWDCSRSKSWPARKMRSTTQKKGQKMPVSHSSPGTTSQGKLRWFHSEAQHGSRTLAYTMHMNNHQYTWLLSGQCVHVVGLVKPQQTLRARDDPNGIQAPQQSKGCWRSMRTVCICLPDGTLRIFMVWPPNYILDYFGQLRTRSHKTAKHLQTESKQLQPQVSRSYVAAVAEENALCRMEGLMTASLLFNLFAKMFDWRTTTNLNILGRQTLQHSSWAQGPQLETVLKWAYICVSGALYTGRYFVSVAPSD